MSNRIPSLIGWIIFLSLMYFVNKTGTGHKILFYTLLLILIYLLVFNYQRIGKIMTKPA